IVTEATSGEGPTLYNKTSGYRAMKGHQIYYFNPDDLGSHRINPLDRVNSVAAARRVTEILMLTTTLKTHKGDQSWEMSERCLLQSMILHAVGERTNGNCNLSFVREMLIKGPEGMSRIMQRSKVKEAQDNFELFLNNSTPPYRNLVCQGVATRLKTWE